MADLNIRKLVSRIIDGGIRIPAFQRDFVWEPDQSAFLLDSIYKGFPIGTIVFWKTEERLKTEKDLGSFVLPEPEKDFPVNYILDGQQRVTSIFSAFQSELDAKDDNWINIYFDLDGNEATQDSRFIALSDDEVDPKRHFPVNTFFESREYRDASNKLNDDQIELIDSVRDSFKEYQIASTTFETVDRNEVAIVFERINRAGTELDVFELLAAWSWSDEFDLVDEFDELQSEIVNHGFGDLVNDRELQLRICAAIITNETSPNKILELQGDDIRSRFDEIKTGILGAIDFLRRELSVKHFKLLPTPGILVPLSVFFATTSSDGVNYSDTQKEKIIEWFWSTCFSRRYFSDVSARQKADIAALLKLRDDETYTVPRNSDLKIDFTRQTFSAGNSNSKSFILMLINRKPHSFLSGAMIELDKVLKKGSRHEFHHIFPKAHLETFGEERKSINCLANFCYLSRLDNNKIKAKSPAVYFDDMSEKNRNEYLDDTLVEYDDRNLSFEEFKNKRGERLVSLANSLMGI